MYHLPILRTVNLKGRQYGRQFVPVDTKTVSHKNVSIVCNDM